MYWPGQASVNMYSTDQIIYEYVDFKNVDATEKIWKIFSVYHIQKDGSEFSDVTLASREDNDNSDVIVLKKLEKFSIGADLQDALQFNVSTRMVVSSPMLLLLPMMITQF